MDVGVFIPIGNNGWLLSTTSPQYKLSFALNRAIVEKAEHYQLDFALSMIKLRGFGRRTKFRDHNLESFTLMAGLAAVTQRIKLYASAAVLILPPAIVARMAVRPSDREAVRFGHLGPAPRFRPPRGEAAGPTFDETHILSKVGASARANACLPRYP
jgi:pyrimidine oxygenase